MAGNKLCLIIMLLLLCLTKGYTDEFHSWMYESRAVIGNKPINQIAMLGSHDAATHEVNLSSCYSSQGDLPDWLEWISDHVPTTIVKKIVVGWSKTQPLPIKQQLQKGIRYFDLRFCYDPAQGIYSCHNLSSTPVDQILQNLTDFIYDSPQELIIFHIQHVSNFNDNVHQQLGHLLHKYLGNLMVPNRFSSKVTPNQLWQTPYRIFVIYNAKEKDDLFWSTNSIASPWPNVIELAELKKKMLDYLLHRSIDKFFVLQTVLTPNKKMILKGLPPLDKLNPGNIEAVAKKINLPLVHFIKNNQKEASFNILLFDWLEDTDELMKMIFILNNSTTRKYQ